MVKKADLTWRMCVDYIDLNKSCPKDCYPLPAIDQKVDALIGFRRKCFLDAYKGYHQILIDDKDAEKTAFITGGVFFVIRRCRLVSKMLDPLIKDWWIEFKKSKLVVNRRSMSTTWL